MGPRAWAGAVVHRHSQTMTAARAQGEETGCRLTRQRGGLPRGGARTRSRRRHSCSRGSHTVPGAARSGGGCGAAARQSRSRRTRSPERCIGTACPLHERNARVRLLGSGRETLRVTGRHSKPACTPGGAPVCVRRCRSKLFDRGEVYWQPGKVHTCTTGIVSYRTSYPRYPETLGVE